MPDFAYTNGIPAASHNPSADQPIMQINNNSINSILGIDHFSFNNANGGWHQQSTYVNGTDPTTVGGQLALYSKSDGAGKSLLFSIRDGNAATVTQLNSTLVNAPSTGFNGFSWLPGGLLIQWGAFPMSNSVLPQTISFNTPFSTTNIFFPLPIVVATGQVSGSPADKSVETLALSNASFEASQFTGIARTIYWVAIGAG
jgi:hypothetical protein